MNDPVSLGVHFKVEVLTLEQLDINGVHFDDDGGKAFQSRELPFRIFDSARRMHSG